MVELCLPEFCTQKNLKTLSWLSYLTVAAHWTLDLVGGWRGGQGGPQLLLHLGLQHGLLTLAAQLHWLHRLQVLPGHVGRSSAGATQTHLLPKGPLPQRPQVAAAVDGVPSQVQARQFGGVSYQRLQDA